MKLKITFTFLAVLWIVNVFSQDYTIVDANGSFQMISDGWMKDSGGEEDFIYNLEKDVLIIVDHQSQKYVKGSMEEYCEASKAMIEKMKNSIPQEQWEMMVNMQKQMPDPEVEISSKGSGGSIAGYATEKYEVLVNGELFEEIWIANDNGLNDLLNFMQKTEEAGEKIMECSSMGEEFLSKDPMSTDNYKELESKGLVMKRVIHEYGMAETDSEVMSIEKGSIDASEFDPPEDYDPQTFIEYMNAQMEREEY